ncbi:hypothetical protein Ancab_032520 [Ancistrocladus abbreviatus]
MAPPPSSSSSPSSSKASNSPSLLPFRSHHFTPIQEGNESEENDDRHRSGSTPGSSVSGCAESVVHHPTPLHRHNNHRLSPNPGKRSEKKRREKGGASDDGLSVSCSDCRPSTREKTSVVPLDSHASPNGIFKSIISGLSRKSPKPASESSSTSAAALREEQWKIAVAELSHKLVQASRKRDEALLEASRLKYSMAELEKKLNKLEIYCHNLKSGLEVCSNQNSPHSMQKFIQFPDFKPRDQDKIIENLLISVSEARSSVRLLSRALTLQIRQMGVKVLERISSLLQPYDVKLSLSKNPRSLLFYLEALLNLAFFEDFETAGFAKNSTNRILNPIDRCEANYSAFSVLQNLTWEEVLSKGTKHFSEEFSRFCDRKMSEIVAMLGWNRAWPEQLLQAFFGASKNVWLVHLLATSVHPSLPIFRIEKGAEFDSIYMEDMGGDKALKLVPTMVRIMVAPGFYVYDNVVKCKVLCRYKSSTNSTSSADISANSSVEKGVNGPYALSK